jgi:hypothetical protein
MEITRINGGIEYRPEYMSLVLPGDRDYRVRTVQASNSGIVQTTVPTSLLTQNGLAYIRPVMSNEEKKAAYDGALAHLKYLGDLEMAGAYLDSQGINVRDEYAGGHRGIIDLWV